MAQDLTDASPAPPGVAYWHDSLVEAPVVRPALTGDLDADVAIVGGGYTGLWTALYLAAAEPSLSIAVIEREHVGFGASGRNGGWCSALFATSTATLVRRYGRPAADALRRALKDAVDEVGRRAQAEEIDCAYHKGGTVVLARSAAQWARLCGEVEEARALGIGEDDLALLGPTEVGEKVRATHVLGGTFTPHCAAIHPARLAHGLARAVERRKVAVFEHTTALEVGPGRVRCAQGTVRAGVVVLATEGYGTDLRGFRRRLAPVYSLMLATAPLDAAAWDEIGLVERETFSDERHLIVYGQRTADGRIAFGGRGAPYHYASAVRPEFDTDGRVHAALEAALRDLFPVLRDVPITHRWGGALGVARDWHPSVGLDRRRGLAWAGGYVGDGVACANLAGRTLAELIMGRTSERTELCWVGHRSPAWEPEPLRYLGINAALGIMASADRAEERTGRPARRAERVGRLMGG